VKLDPVRDELRSREKHGAELSTDVLGDADRTHDLAEAIFPKRRRHSANDVIHRGGVVGVSEEDGHHHGNQVRGHEEQEVLVSQGMVGVVGPGDGLYAVHVAGDVAKLASFSGFRDARVVASSPLFGRPHVNGSDSLCLRRVIQLVVQLLGRIAGAVGHSRAVVDGGPGRAVSEGHGQSQAVVSVYRVPIVKSRGILHKRFLGARGHSYLFLFQIISQTAVIEHTLPMISFPLPQNDALALSRVGLDKFWLGQHHHGRMHQAFLRDVCFANGRGQFARKGDRVHYAFRIDGEPDGFVPGSFLGQISVELHNHLISQSVGNIFPSYFPFVVGEMLRGDNIGGGLFQLIYFGCGAGGIGC